MSPLGLKSNPNCTTIEHKPMAQIFVMHTDFGILSVAKALKINAPEGQRISERGGFRSTGTNAGNRHGK